MGPLLAVFLLACAPSHAAGAARISVVELRGTLTAGGKTLAKGDEVDGSSPIELSADGEATLRLKQGMILLMGPASFTAAGDALVLKSGGLLAVLRRLRRRWKVVTPRAVAAVRGTVFFIKADRFETYLCLCEGSLIVSGTGSAKASSQTLRSTHHSPFILRSSGDRLDVIEESMKDHDDREIAALKALL